MGQTAMAVLAALLLAVPACADSEQLSLRLYGANTDAGRVEVLRNGTWGAICGSATSWGGPTRLGAAHDICQHLGFERAVAAGLWHSRTEDLPYWAQVSDTASIMAMLAADPPAEGVECGEGGRAISVACIAKGGDSAQHPRPMGTSGDILRNTVAAEAEAAQAPRGGGACDAGVAVVDSGVPLTPQHIAEAYSFADQMQESLGKLKADVDSTLAADEGLAGQYARWVGSGALRVTPLGFELDRAAVLPELFKGNVQLDANHTLAMRMAGFEGLAKKLFMRHNDHSSLQWHMDEPWRLLTPAEQDAVSGGTTAARELYRDGIAVVEDWGFSEEEIVELNRVADEEMLHVDPERTSVVSGGAVVTSRVQLPAVERMLKNETLIDMVRSYLGDDVVVSGYKLTRLTASLQSEEQYIASRWHHDRVGRRLKMFVFLHDIDCEEGHPTQVVKGSHNTLYHRTETFASSRYPDAYIRANYNVSKACGVRGGGFIFDTHTIHKGTQKGANDRTTVIIEFHNTAKCPFVLDTKLGLPCPSGDSFMLNQRLVRDRFRLPDARYADDVGSSVQGLEGTPEEQDAFLGWRFFPHDVIPPVPPNAVVSVREADGMKVGVCYFEGLLGVAEFDGEDGGACITTRHKVFGDFHLLLKQRKTLAATGEPHATGETVRLYAAKYLTAEDTALLEDVTGTPVARLLDAIAQQDEVTPGFAQKVLSPERFIAVEENLLGLHPFRCLLGERMTRARRAAYVVTHAQRLFSDDDEAESLQRDLAEWEQNGFLLKNYTRMVEGGAVRLRKLLEMVTGGDPIQDDLSFVPRTVTHVTYDTQYQAHVDTFHSVIKMWVYPASVTLQDGPLHVIPGSHVNTRQKLGWAFHVTQHNTTIYDVAEASLRLWGSPSQRYGLPDPVAMIPNSDYTHSLVVADTSGIHFRGHAPPGTTRVSLRPIGGENDGGVTRRSPFREPPAQQQ